MRRTFAGLILGAATVLAPTPAFASGHIAHAGGATAVPDSYVVSLKTHGGTPSAHSLATRFGGTVTHDYPALRGFAVRLSESAARRLAADPAVASVAQNHRVSLADGDLGTYGDAGQQPNPPWGLDRIDQRRLPLNQLYRYPSTASNVTIYSVDTGIRTTHTEFGGRARHGWDFVDNDADATDCNGHGTWTSGVAGARTHGVAKRAKLVAVRVLSCAGGGTTAQVIAGVDWVTRNAVKPAVGLATFGGSANDTIDAAVKRSIAAGVTWSVVGGSSNTDACGFSPGRVPEALTSSATDQTDTRRSSSNFGPCIDLFAPGANIPGPWITSDTDVRTLSGGSAAAAHVAGGAALWLADRPLHTPAQVAAGLIRWSTKDVVQNPGPNTPNRLLYVNWPA